MESKRHLSGAHALDCKFFVLVIVPVLLFYSPSLFVPFLATLSIDEKNKKNSQHSTLTHTLSLFFSSFLNNITLFRVKITYPNGDTFEGEVNDLKKRHGQGKYTHPAPVPDEDAGEEEATVVVKDHVYDGAWINGEKEGIGKMFYPDGARYYGQWSHNVPHGEGTYKYTNGDVYSGQWSKGVKTGQGSYEYGSNGSQLAGVWTDGSISTGQWIYKNGDAWQADFKNGKPIGKASLVTKISNNQQNGEWVEILQDEADEEGVTNLIWKGDIPETAPVRAAELNRAAYKKNLPDVDWSTKEEVKEEEE